MDKKREKKESENSICRSRFVPRFAKSNEFVDGDEKVRIVRRCERDWSFGGTFSGAWKVLLDLE